MKKNTYFLIFAQNYVTYHSSMYEQFYKKSKKRSIVVYEDSVGQSDKFEKRWGKIVKWGINLKKGYKSILLKNYSYSSNNQGFFSRFNPQIPFVIKKVMPKKIFFQGYSDFSSWIILITSKLFKIQVSWKGERVLNKNSKDSKFKKFILKNFFFNFVDVIYYSCNGNLEYLKSYGINDKKLKNMNCSVNNSFFRSNKKLKKINLLNKKKLGLYNKKVILIVANLEKRKNIMLFMDTAKFFINKKVHFLIVGDGALRDKVKQKIIQNKSQLSYLGFIDISKISEIYSIADVFCVLSSYDPSPKTLNEALNFDIPSIVYKEIGTSKDLIKNGINGKILNRLNSYSLSKSINEVLSDKSLQIKSKIYNNQLLKKYSPEQNANALFN
jgi:glycosyltransferase involved in cell wall biosynthesis